MISVTFPLLSNKDIETEATRIREEIYARNAELKVLQTLLQTVQSFCKHAGQHTGHNERDGSWGSPCPTCGYSY